MSADAASAGVPARARVLLAGPWSDRHVDALRGSFTVVGEPADAVDWVIAAAQGRAADGCTPGSVRRLAGAVRASASPSAKVAVVDQHAGPRVWTDCDVYIAGPVEPDELAAALWLADRGFSLCRPGAPSGLTPREIEVLGLLRGGFGNDQIARFLAISRSTVEFHLTRIFKKLGVVSRAEAIARVGHYGIPLRAKAGLS